MIPVLRAFDVIVDDAVGVEAVVHIAAARTAKTRVVLIPGGVVVSQGGRRAGERRRFATERVSVDAVHGAVRDDVMVGHVVRGNAGGQGAGIRDDAAADGGRWHDAAEMGGPGIRAE